MERKRWGHPTLEDVADAAGVSTATVSRCLNEPGKVREDTRERVMAAVTQLGYAPHFGGRTLAMHRTGTLGVVVPTIDNAIFARGLQAMQKRLADSDTTLLISSSGYDPAVERARIMTLVARGVDGLMLVGESRDEDIHDFLRARRLPFVCCWAWRQDSPNVCIGFDNRAAARDIAARVVAAGHGEIAVIAGITSGNDRAAGRLAGFLEALDAHGTPVAPSRVTEVRYTLADGAAAARRILEDDRRVTALVCGNDILAIGAMKGIREAGLSCPGDVSVTGFDDIDLASFSEPQLATLGVSDEWMGRKAAETLIAMSAGEVFAPPGFCAPTEFKPRASLAAPRAGG